MKLDRNINGDGRGKYALLRLRRLDDFKDPADPFGTVAEPIASAISTLEAAGILDWGEQGSHTEFMVIRLKDRNAKEALDAYAREARNSDPEYADEVAEMARRAGPASPWCKEPD
jgi:hypothetical protein